VHEWKHACAILNSDFPGEWQDVIDVLANFRLKRSWLRVGGGRKSGVSAAIDVALEIEWNNKDPFFDRDLNNFRLLLDLRVVSVGVIITRCDNLQEIFDKLARGKSYGASTTHMSKVLPRIGGGGCPILVFGKMKSLYEKD
jgi:hypothetical protein